MIDVWRIQLFGSLRVSQGERVITRFRTQKTAALLAYLAYYLGRSHTREMLIEHFWPDSGPESGRHSLSLALSSLRNQLEPPGVPAGSVIIADRYSVELNPDATETDVREFERALRSAAQGRNSDSFGALLAQAVSRYEGALLPEFYEDWVALERERLVERFFDGSHQLVVLLEKAGDLETALEFGRKAVKVDPLREEAQRDLIRVLAASGQPNQALHAFRSFERQLEDELGEEPTYSMRELIEQIQVQSDEAGAAIPERPLKTPQEAGIRAKEKPILSNPSGTVTFLLTEFAGSTALCEKPGETFRSGLAAHRALVRSEFRRAGGYEVKEAGDSYLVAFSSVSDALSCAVAAQRALSSQPWPHPVDRVRARMALHTGDAEFEDGDYHCSVLHHASSILNAAHGGQILCSEATSALLRRDLEPGLQLQPLGIFRLRDVEAPERLFQVLYHDIAVPAFPPINAEPAVTARLPLQFTRFFGRQKEIVELEHLVSGGVVHEQVSDYTPLTTGHSRLITLTGAGGTGKTRLAIEIAGRVGHSFEGGVWFVNLAEVEDPNLISAAILEAVGVPRTASLPGEDQAVQALNRGRCLLILDNFEQLAVDGSEVVMKLLERSLDLTCVVTSRHLLGLQGEREFTVPPLSTPENANAQTPEGLTLYESVQLFVDRSQAVKPDFRVTNSNAAAVAELCDRLEGIPLAIELAAARAQVMTPSQMLIQLTNRFEFLVSRRRGVAERQRTLRAAVDWSFRLLSPELQEFYCKLSAFRGGWTVEAAEAVCDDNLAMDHLAQLRECSLVLTEESDREMRFRMLDSLREYASQRLTPEHKALLGRRHAEWVVSLAERCERELLGTNEREWLERMELEHANARAAIEWTRSNSAESTGRSGHISIGLRISASLARFWSIRGHAREARPLVESLLAVANGGMDIRLKAAALDTMGSLAHDMGDFSAARDALDRSLTMWRDLGEAARMAYTLNLRANVALDQGSDQEAEPLYQEALRMYREAGDKRGIGMALSNLSVVALQRGEDERAANLMEESLRIKRRLGNRYSLAIALENLGNHQRRLGDLDRAREHHDEALSIRRALGHKQGVAMSLNNLGHVLLALRDLDAAAAYLSESITLFYELGDSRGLAEALEGAAGVLFAHEQHELGANLLGASQGVLDAQSDASNPAPEAESRCLAATARKTLGEKKYEKALNLGRTWLAEESIKRANDLLLSDSA